MPDLNIVDDVAHVLTRCTRGLKTLNSSTEADFLTIGTHLRDVSTAAGEIATMAKSTADLVSSAELEGGIAALQEIFTRMDQYLRFSEKKLAQSTGTLRTMLAEVGNVHEPLRGFTRIVKHLRMLSISTKIESSRLITGDGNFGNIADDVERLSTLIDSKSADILHAVNSLHGAIGDTLSRVGVLETWEHGQARGIVDNILAGLSALSEKHTLSSTAARHIAAGSEEIGGNIGEIVNSLQFHDITRQQIEHVTEALDELLEKISALEVKTDADAGPEDLFIPEVCGLQVNQLSNAKRELISAIQKTLQSLSGISRGAGNISKEIAALVGINEAEGTSFLIHLKDDVARIISSLRENRDASSELASAVERVTTTIGELSSFVEDIEDVGVEIELIALNARVKAAKTGAEGAALGVLAEAVRNLSDTSRDQTGAVSRTLTRLSDIAGSLNRDQEGTERAVEVDDIVGRLGGLLASFSDMDRRITSLISRMDDAGRSLSLEIGELASGITVHDTTEREIEATIKDIEGATAKARQLGPSTVTATEKAAYLKRFEDRYTMHGERHVHHTYIRPGASVALAHKNKSSGLGDNVELF